VGYALGICLFGMALVLAYMVKVCCFWKGKMTSTYH
jgi:hypothetical protein